MTSPSSRPPGGGASDASVGGSDPRPDVADASLGELIGDVTRDLSTLMRQELDLAKAELKQEVTKSGKAGGTLGGAALAAYMVVLFLSIALWWALGTALGFGWAAVIVAALWAVVAAVLYSTGRRQLREVRPMPERTVDTLKELPDTLKGR